MGNVKQIWEETTKRLEKVYDRREAENISYLLLEDLFDLNRTAILSKEKKEIDENLLQESLIRLLNYEPIQYVTGIADFYGRKFFIAPGALIPRPETEELCGLIINENEIDNPRILDVGVGSGCIAVTLALELGAKVFGTDVSKETIVIAEKNAEKLDANTEFYLSDILKENLPEDRLDILVSNPPYIPEYEKETLRANVSMFEPNEALFVQSEDPLLFYRLIAKKGRGVIRTGGKLYFEIHESYGQETKILLEELGYIEVVVHQDMQCKDRMISSTKV